VTHPSAWALRLPAILVFPLAVGSSGRRETRKGKIDKGL
jgi:hypothetical protein